MDRFVLATACCLTISCADDLGAAGDLCTTSADCAAGLLCDTAQSPPVCASMSSPRPDLAGVEGDLSASAHDLAVMD